MNKHNMPAVKTVYIKLEDLGFIRDSAVTPHLHPSCKIIWFLQQLLSEAVPPPVVTGPGGE